MFYIPEVLKWKQKNKKPKSWNLEDNSKKW
jgi:hypothetical protein